MGRKKEGSAENGCFKGRRPAWPLLAGLAMVTLLAAVSCGGAAGEQQRAEGPTEDEQVSVDKSQVETEEPQESGADLGDPSLGEEDAPVVMTEYADYQ